MEFIGAVPPRPSLTVDGGAPVSMGTIPFPIPGGLAPGKRTFVVTGTDGTICTVSKNVTPETKTIKVNTDFFCKKE